MARAVRDAKLESPTARAKLKISPVPHWRGLDPGLHLGYRKSKSGGKWVARWYLRDAANQGGKAYTHATLDGITDDRQPADGATVLNFAQAQKAARALYAAATAPARPGGPLTVREAAERYVAYLRAERKTAEGTAQRLALHVYPDIAGWRRDISEARDEIERKKKLHANAARLGSARAKDRLARLAAREARLAAAEKELPTLSLGDRPVSELTMNEIEAIKRAMVRRDPADPEVERRSKDSANRVLTMLKAALNRAFADESNHIPSDAAWRRVRPFKDVARARDVFLDIPQQQRLINVCSGAFRALVTAALLTGARPPHELAGAKVKDFSAALGTLRVDGKTGRRDIVLRREAVEFFKEIAAGRAPDALLLPNDDGTAWRKSQHARPMRAAVARAKLPKGTTIYSLRHSHASQALLNGMNLKLLTENMGTSIAMLEKHYGKFTQASRQKLIEQHGPHLGLKRGNVVTIA